MRDQLETRVVAAEGGESGGYDAFADTESNLPDASEPAAEGTGTPETAAHAYVEDAELEADIQQELTATLPSLF